MLTLAQHKLVIPLVFDVNLYFFIMGDLRILRKSRKLRTIINCNRPNFTFSYRFMWFPGVPGPPPVFPGPPSGAFSEGSESYSEYSECSSEKR